MSSRSEQIRQLGLQGKILYKAGTSSDLHAKVLDTPVTNDNLAKITQSFISSVVPLEPIPSTPVPVLELESDNQDFLFDNNSYIKLTPVSNVIIVEETIMEEIPIVDPTPEELRTYHDSDTGQDCQEESFQDSGSSYTPSGNKSLLQMLLPNLY